MSYNYVYIYVFYTLIKSQKTESTLIGVMDGLVVFQAFDKQP